MNKKNLLKEIIADFHAKPLRATKPRSVILPLELEKIIVLTGPRRAGKTSLLLHTIKELTQTLPLQQILYINFEDERLSLKSDELDLILQSYRELYPDTPLERVWLFFDEIQEVEGWERFIRRCEESITRHIVLTGSNAKLLGSEIATALRGRAYRIDLFPLSFAEYLQFLEIKPEIHGAANRAKIIHAFEHYLRFGGFPEMVALSTEEQKRRVLQEYYDVMIFRDILERYAQTNLHAIKYFLKRLVESVKSPLSLSKIHNEMKSLGFRVGKNSLYEYLEFAEAVFFALPARKFDPSIKRQELADKKSYIIDNGYLTALSASPDVGKKLENLVAIELVRRGVELRFAKNGKECDFIQSGETPVALQVCADLSDPDTLEREMQGALFGAKLSGAQKARILTLSEERMLERDGVVVEVVPAWKWCLDGV